MANRLHDLTGQKFGHLTVLQLDLEKSTPRRKFWKCQCECGNIKSIRSDSLTSKKSPTVSCGCYNLKRKQEAKHYKDISGNKYGLLTALEPCFRLNTQGKMYWRCQCECGTIIEVINQDLFSGHTKSCGCIKSKGQLKISTLLINNNIPFEKEKQFETCIYSKQNTKPRFDFYVNNEYLIEYDGKQHFQSSQSGWDTLEQLKLTKKRDAFKNQWCKNNNIPLIRIPYTHYDDLCIEDLLLETSQFVIK